MKELIFIVEEAPEGGYTARALGESIYTEADTREDLHEQVRDAVRCHFDDGETPRIIVSLLHAHDDGSPAKTSAVAALVCAGCGLTKLYASEPEKLLF